MNKEISAFMVLCSLAFPVMALLGAIAYRVYRKSSQQRKRHIK
jgi:hypothetical protein